MLLRRSVAAEQGPGRAAADDGRPSNPSGGVVAREETPMAVAVVPSIPARPRLAKTRGRARPGQAGPPPPDHARLEEPSTKSRFCSTAPPNAFCGGRRSVQAVRLAGGRGGAFPHPLGYARGAVRAVLVGLNFAAARPAIACRHGSTAGPQVSAVSRFLLLRRGRCLVGRPDTSRELATSRQVGDFDEGTRSGLVPAGAARRSRRRAPTLVGQ